MRDRCGYGYVATPRGASQRALCRLTTHLTPQWPERWHIARSLDAYCSLHAHLNGVPDRKGGRDSRRDASPRIRRGNGGCMKRRTEVSQGWARRNVHALPSATKGAGQTTLRHDNGESKDALSLLSLPLVLPAAVFLSCDLCSSLRSRASDEAGTGSLTRLTERE